MSEALEREFGLAQRWGHLRLLDGSVCWLHCWNESADGSLVDATADQFEEMFPGDVLILAPTDPLACRYLAAPAGRDFDVRLEAGQLQLAVDGVNRGAWADEMQGWLELADVVLGAMSPWPQQSDVCEFAAEHLRRRGPRQFTKRDLEGPIDLWAWQRREESRGQPWLPGDLGRDGMGALRRRANAVEVRPVAGTQQLVETIELAVRRSHAIMPRRSRRSQ